MAKIKIYISFAVEDDIYCKELEKHLLLSELVMEIELWHVGKIQAGEFIESIAEKKLSASDLILLLISVDYINTDRCYRVELNRAMERYASGTVDVIPVILRHGNYSGAAFAELCSFPHHPDPVASWPDRDEVWTLLAQEVLRRAEKISGRNINRTLQKDQILRHSCLDKRYRNNSIQILSMRKNNSTRKHPTIEFIIKNKSSKSVILHHILINMIDIDERLGLSKQSRLLKPLAQLDIALPESNGCFEYDLDNVILVAGDDAVSVVVRFLGKEDGQPVPLPNQRHIIRSFYVGFAIDDEVSFAKELFNTEDLLKPYRAPAITHDL